MVSLIIGYCLFLCKGLHTQGQIYMSIGQIYLSPTPFTWVASKISQMFHNGGLFQWTSAWANLARTMVFISFNNMGTNFITLPKFPITRLYAPLIIYWQLPMSMCLHCTITPKHNYITPWPQKNDIETFFRNASMLNIASIYMQVQ